MALRILPFSASALVIGLALSGCKGGEECPEGQTLGADNICRDDETDVQVGVGNITVDPCGYDFGAVEVNSLASVTIKVFNTGTGTLEVSSVAVGTTQFSTTASPVKVGPGAPYQFSVRFEPDAFGDFTDTLTITSNDPDSAVITCALSGSVQGDVDGDGFISDDAGGDDCDDNDAEIYPGAYEQYYDGKDADCDGYSDFDQDRDGYESKVFNPNPDAGGGDCQDVNAAINPKASDVWYDGLDTNCDGRSDFDQDGDGEDASTYGGTDCNDEDPLENTSGVEAFDGHDNDCNGLIDDGITADVATATIYGPEVTATGGTGDACGSGIAAGDFNGDGTTDLVIGCGWDTYVGGATGTAGDATGGIAVFMDEGWVDGDITDTDYDNYVAGAGTTDEFGSTVTNIGDMDGDDIDDVAITAQAYSSKRGRVYVFSGPDVESGALTDAVATITGGDDYQLGITMSSKTDLNADGLGDLIMFGKNSYGPYNYLAIVYGEISGALDWDDTDAYWAYKCGDSSYTGRALYCGPPAGTSGVQGGSPYFPRSAGAEHNLDGDGYPDLLMGDAFYDESYKQDGKVWALWGKSSQYVATGSDIDSYATTLAKGTKVKHFVGQSVGMVSDADGDGDDEFFIQDGDAELLYYFEGDSGLRSGNLDLQGDSVANFVNDEEITGFATLGDWDSDGTGDFGMVFGEEGYLYLFSGQIFSGDELELDKNAIATIGAGTSSDQLGWSFVAHEIDTNGDGTPDLVVGDNKYKDSSRGAVHLFEQ